MMFTIHLNIHFHPARDEPVIKIAGQHWPRSSQITRPCVIEDSHLKYRLGQAYYGQAESYHAHCSDVNGTP